MRFRLPPARRFRDDRGTYSLPELLVGSALLLVIFAAILTLIPMAFRQSQASQDRTFSVLDVRTSLEKMVRELRTATALAPTAQKMVYDTLEHSVTIECTAGGGYGDAGQGQGGGSCIRRQAPLGQNPANEPGVSIASGIVNTDVFCVAQGPSNRRDYVGIKLVMDTSGGAGHLTLNGGTALRNAQNFEFTTPLCPN